MHIVRVIHDSRRNKLFVRTVICTVLAFGKIYLTVVGDIALKLELLLCSILWFSVVMKCFLFYFGPYLVYRPKTEEENYLQAGYTPLFVTPYIQLLFFTQTYLHLCGWVHIYCSFWCRYSTCCGQKWLSKKKNTLLAYLGKNI